LVEGSVALSQKWNEENKVTLKPNQKGSFHQDDKKISLENVKTYFYTSWLEGKLVFRNEKFNSIIKTLERSFNIEINNSNEELGNELFNATFDNKSIDEILSYFKEIHHVNYNIENNSIFIY
jgi:ferric-dicitrate binding protein FerR (iron transport regulator)